MFPMYVAENHPRANAEDIAATIHPHPTLSETYQDVTDMFGVGAVH